MRDWYGLVHYTLSTQLNNNLKTAPKLLRLALLAQNAAEHPVENDDLLLWASEAVAGPTGPAELGLLPTAGLVTGLPPTLPTLRPRAGRGSLC